MTSWHFGGINFSIGKSILVHRYGKNSWFVRSMYNINKYGKKSGFIRHSTINYKKIKVKYQY